jgi:hypothetical protein
MKQKLQLLQCTSRCAVPENVRLFRFEADSHKGIHMRMRTIECSARIILFCRCGEVVVLLGRPVDWYDEDQLEFLCECGEILTLDNVQSVENPV